MKKKECVKSRGKNSQADTGTEKALQDLLMMSPARIDKMHKAHSQMNRPNYHEPVNTEQQLAV